MCAELLLIQKTSLFSLMFIRFIHSFIYESDEGGETEGTLQSENR